jgi:hypothetical protein
MGALREKMIEEMKLRNFSRPKAGDRRYREHCGALVWGCSVLCAADVVCLPEGR